MILTIHYTNTDVGMNHIEVLMEPKYMSKSLTQALTTLSAFALQSLKKERAQETA